MKNQVGLALDIDKVVPVHVDVSTLSDVVKNDVKKNCVG